MSDVFISYSRKDDSFVRRLQEALERSGREVWIDWQAIPPSADWMAEIYGAVETANNFIFVLSPDSIGSEICALELAHAASHNKRIIPLLCREIDSRAVPDAAARHNWISFVGEDGFERAFGQVIEALETDLEWVAAHTHWLARARHWEREGRERSSLLRGHELRSANKWLASYAPGKEPEPTPLQVEYASASSRVAARRQRMITGAIAAALIVSIVLTIVAVIQRNEAEEQKRMAQSLAVTATARQVLRLDLLLATRLASEAVSIARTPEAEGVLRRAVGAIEHRELLAGHSASIRAAAFSPDGERVVTASADRTARIWDAASGEQIGVLRGRGSFVLSAAFSPDGERVVTASDDRTARIWACGPVCLPLDDLIPIADRLAGQLTDAERANYLSG